MAVNAEDSLETWHESYPLSYGYIFCDAFDMLVELDGELTDETPILMPIVVNEAADDYPVDVGGVHMVYKNVLPPLVIRTLCPDYHDVNLDGIPSRMQVTSYGSEA
jgi:hypothetical protein